MFRLWLLALVAIFLAVGGVGLATRAADASSPYALVRAAAGKPPVFEVQDGMTSVRRVGAGRYCLLAAVKFDHRTIGQVSAADRPGFVVVDTSTKRCKPEELGVTTYQLRAGRLRLSNDISFAANPEG